ncbi:MAG: Fe-S cluster assembly protein SufD [Ignavibacteria bacterium]|nr:Fe-S cluster assembly protein SufD [Ignavibacteria bacterium]
MNNIDIKEWYKSEFANLEKNLNGESSSEVHLQRKYSLEKLLALPFPTLKDEDWRYTDVSSLNDKRFSATGKAKISKEALRKYLFKKSEYITLVYVNGLFDEKNSQLGSLPEGVTLSHSLSAASGKTLGSTLDTANYFSMLNSAFMNQGTVLQLKKNTVLETPVYILHVTTTENAAIYPRNYIMLEDNSQATVIENYVRTSDAEYFTNSVTEIFVGENSQLTHVRIQDESLNAYFVNNTQVRQKQNAVYTSYNISFGSRLSRTDLQTHFEGQNGESHLYGLYIAGGEQLVDNHTMIDHAVPNCQSNEVYKGVLAGNARGVFNGKVLVRPDAQKTAAFQQNKNILLSETALVDTKPQLEIFADDVKCSHGATVGQLDENALFYLRSRGFGKDLARSILIFAFAEDVVRSIKLAPVVEYLEGKLNEKLNFNF